MVADPHGLGGFSRAPVSRVTMEWKSLVVIQTPDAIEQSVPISIAFPSTGLRWTSPVKPVRSPMRSTEPGPI